MLAVWSITVALLVGYIGNTAVADQQVCSSFCSSLGMLQSNPGRSCNDIYQVNKASRGRSDYYWIETAAGLLQQVYCDMELECGGHKGGWMRIADVDASTAGACPSGWTFMTTPSQPPNPAIPTCRASISGCSATVFTVHETNYSKVCGKVRGYQKGLTDSFLAFATATFTSIDDPYVDGISITSGTPRKHIWTYATGQTDDTNLVNNCPCAALSGSNPPPFVQDHYYCESGSQGGAVSNSYYTSDPLWDGDECVGVNNNCCASHGKPWFLRQFPAAQSDDIEVRICGLSADEEVLVDQLELYVQ